MTCRRRSATAWSRTTSPYGVKRSPCMRTSTAASSTPAGSGARERHAEGVQRAREGERGRGEVERVGTEHATSALLGVDADGRRSRPTSAQAPSHTAVCQCSGRCRATTSAGPEVGVVAQQVRRLGDVVLEGAHRQLGAGARPAPTQVTNGAPSRRAARRRRASGTVWGSRVDPTVRGAGPAVWDSGPDAGSRPPRRRSGDAAASADRHHPQADAPRRRRPVHRAPDRAGARGRRHAGRPRHVVQARGVPRLLRRRLALRRRARLRHRGRAARHRRCDPPRRAVPRERPRRPGARLQRRRALRPRHRRAGDSAGATTPPTSRSTSRASTTRAPTASCPPTPTAGCCSSSRSPRRPRRSSPTRSTPAATSSAARSSTRSPPAARCRSSARRSRACSARAPSSPGSSTTATGSTSARRWTSCRARATS